MGVAHCGGGGGGGGTCCDLEPQACSPREGGFPDGSIQGGAKTLFTTPDFQAEDTRLCLKRALVLTPDRDDGSRPCRWPVGPAGSSYLQGVEDSKHVLEDQGPVTDGQHSKHP